MLLTLIYLTYIKKDNVTPLATGMVVVVSVFVWLLLGFHITLKYGNTYNIRVDVSNKAEVLYDTRKITGDINRSDESNDYESPGQSSSSAADYRDDKALEQHKKPPPQQKGKRKHHRKKWTAKVFKPNNYTIDTSYLHGKEIPGTNHIILYNRVPKCGSRTLLLLVETMAKKNHFNHRLGEINPRARKKGVPEEEISFESLIRRRIKNTKVGVFLHGHVYFQDFSKDTSLPPHKKPIYINLLRDPVSRFVSAYYFSRFGDGRFTNLKQLHKLTRPQYINETINECFERERHECVGEYAKGAMMRYFCGYSDVCKKATREALELAKQNIDKYVVVGLVEEYELFLKILEKLIPDFFRGILNEYLSSSEKKKEAKMHAKHKVPPTPEVAARMKESFALDYEFYNYTRSRLHELRDKLGIT